MKERMEVAKSRLPELESARDQHTQYYEVELDKKKATLTHEGTAEAQRKAGVGSFYVGDNIDLPHLLEQSIRAHTVYQRDRDYVVAPDDKGELGVVIVDQNTGRKMIGRQWSDGLHQAVEAKEGVKIKEETQTMATITIQNFFKMYRKLAGMTGTADTEATEFHEIYKLDVICIPTNVPVQRDDHNDLVFIAVKDKWDSIVDEIKTFHDVGRPVLVGTTSVEKSGLLSDMLTRKHQIKHEVLNAKFHEREAEIIAGAGKLGAVMIATNMAGRGTDIKLGRFAKEELIDHWKRRNIAPREVEPSWPEEKIVAASYRHIAPRELDVRKDEVAKMSDADIRRALFEKWAIDHTYLSDKKIKSLNEDELLQALDSRQSCLMHRLKEFRSIEDMGGLHVIGTGRHEARRIDNQLRGRCGRQGDKGSSRFFLSLEDDLMKMFAGGTTLKVLSKLGMKEGDAIESPMLSRAVERAQRKVEERNFLWRKNILEYDEIMNVQRGSFYGTRQDILEGRHVKELIFEQIDAAIADAAETYLDKNYRFNCMSEGARKLLAVNIDGDRLRGKDREDLHHFLRINAKEENLSILDVTIPEFLPAEGDREDWDFKGLLEWANPRYTLNLRISDVREKTPAEIKRLLEQAGEKMVDEADLTSLDQFLAPNYGGREFAQWANNKFGTDFKAEDFEKLEPEQAAEVVMERARKAYHQREITYPVDFALDMTAANLQRDPQAALAQLANWARTKFNLEWTRETLATSNPKEVRDRLMEAARSWDDDKIARRAQEAASKSNSPEELDKWFQDHYGARLTDAEREEAKEDRTAAAEEKIRAILRAELTQFERWILLQIFDTAWKDHLHSMDQVRDAIGFRSFSQKDPRIEFKREGSRLFEEMQSSVREKVTDLVFKARLQPAIARPPVARPAPGAPRADGQGASATAAPNGEGAAPAPAQHRPAPPQPAQPATAAVSALAARNRADAEAAEQAGSAGQRPKRQPRTVAVTVGRNEPCPCGSGKKFKQCCGRKS
jgi:preprotein translocase subunit SecA